MSEGADGAAAESSIPDLSDGRYLYSVVRVDDGDEQPQLEIDGVDEEPVSIVTAHAANAGGERDDAASIGAVVHACDELYDAADPRLVKRWLVQHQRVVDEATERFGTPVPFQFDTILRGGDDGVREWLQSERETLRESLEALAGTQEYRIDVVRTDPIPEAAIVETDEELQALRRKIDDASEGRAHLLEKQFERTLASRRRERDRSLAADVEERIDECVSALQSLGQAPSISLGDVDEATGDAAEADAETTEEAAGETVRRFAVLATDDGVDELGSLLDSVADRDGIAVRFTGPWPPYSFVPSFGSDEEVS